MLRQLLRERSHPVSGMQGREITPTPGLGNLDLVLCT